VAPLAAVLRLELEAEEDELAAAVVQLARELPSVLPLLDVGGDLLGDEAPHGLAQLLVLLGEGREGGANALVLDDVHAPILPATSWCGLLLVLLVLLALALLVLLRSGGRLLSVLLLVLLALDRRLWPVGNGGRLGRRHPLIDRRRRRGLIGVGDGGGVCHLHGRRMPGNGLLHLERHQSDSPVGRDGHCPAPDHVVLRR